MEKRYGWICTKCGKCLNPDIKACNCYKEEIKEEPVKTNPFPSKDNIWIKDWPTPYDVPKFDFFTTSGNPCESCPNKNAPYCHCTLATPKIWA